MAVLCALNATVLYANPPGGTLGQGANVTVTDNGDGTVTMANGIVAIVIVKATSRLNAVTYTFHQDTATKSSPMLLGHGQYYYGGFMLGSGMYGYSLATDPVSNHGDYADVMLLSTSDSNGVMENHFSMLRGSPGYYSTSIMTHRAQDAAFELTAWGVVTRVPTFFNWLSADPARNFLIGTPTSAGVKVPNSPHEITVCLNGSQEGAFADKFIYGQDHADQRAWGWSSVGQGNQNIGIWMMTTMEFSNGGPMKRDVGVYAYNNLNNSILTGELGMGSDGHLGAGELWTKTCGPWFVYMNNVSASITAPADAAKALYADAVAQAAAEQQAWPYAWFTNAHYVPEAGRGSVDGTFVIADRGNPNATVAGLWVGLEEQPITVNGTHDFQKWLKPYQFWVQTDEHGHFSIPHVLPGANYTLWAYGPGAAGTFLSQNQIGGNPPIECSLPTTPFSVRVTAQTTTHLGTVTWTPTCVGETVFELGFPNRKAGKFRRGEDYWSPDNPPKLGFPTPIWGGQMSFPLDFPDGLHYTVGRSRWATDWNYCLPSLPNQQGDYQPCSGSIAFQLAEAPASGAKASFYLGCAGDDGGNIIIAINGTDLSTVSGVIANPNALAATGFNPPYSDDSSIHLGDHGPFSDERITFPATLLHQGANTITITKNATKLTAYLMVDYCRLELTGYVPPAPESVSAYAGKSSVLVRWTLVPGATSYDLRRSSTPNGETIVIAPGIVGPVSGSGASVMTLADASAVPGSMYYYRVQSVNPAGRSVMSRVSDGVIRSAEGAESPPVAPSGVHVTKSGHRHVSLAWTASVGASWYRVWRTTVCSNGVGGTYPLRTILLDDVVGELAYTDNTPTDGRQYEYSVDAVNAAGTSSPSAAVTAMSMPAPPTTAPTSLMGHWIKIRQGTAISLSWSPVPGATGYVLYRTKDPNGTYHWPADFITTISEITYLDKNDKTDKNEKPERKVDPGTDYWYQISAVNAAGVSPAATIHVAPEGH